MARGREFRDRLTTDGDLDIGGRCPEGQLHAVCRHLRSGELATVVNKQTGQWGLSYDKSQDLGRVKMTMSKPAATVENLKYTLTDAGGDKGKLELAWEDHVASVPITVSDFLPVAGSGFTKLPDVAVPLPVPSPWPFREQCRASRRSAVRVSNLRQFPCEPKRSDKAHRAAEQKCALRSDARGKAARQQAAERGHALERHASRSHYPAPLLVVDDGLQDRVA